MLVLPAEAEIAAQIGKDVDSDIVKQARDLVRCGIAKKLMKALKAAYSRNAEVDPYAPDIAGTARRSLRYTALGLIAAADADLGITFARKDLAGVSNMTAEIGALTSLLSSTMPECAEMLAAFYQRHKTDPLIVDKWFGLQAAIPGSDASQRIAKLLAHAEFKLSTPNRVML